MENGGRKRRDIVNKITGRTDRKEENRKTRQGQKIQEREKESKKTILEIDPGEVDVEAAREKK